MGTLPVTLNNGILDSTDCTLFLSVNFKGHSMSRLFIAIILIYLNGYAYSDNTKISISSGYFDDFLMLAVDNESQRLSGYYDDGKCRFYFKGPLIPVELYQRRDFGEAYTPESIVIGKKRQQFTTEIYSRAKNGFYNQLTIEPSIEDKRTNCRSRISLDRSSSVSNSFIGVRVIGKNKPKLYQIKSTGSDTLVVRDRKTKSLKKYQGVWVAKTYSPAYSPEGYQYINWYDQSGKPFAAYIKDEDLVADIVISE
jgi:hypothetical protein